MSEVETKYAQLSELQRTAISNLYQTTSRLTYVNASDVDREYGELLDQACELWISISEKNKELKNLPTIEAAIAQRGYFKNSEFETAQENFLNFARKIYKKIPMHPRFTRTPLGEHLSKEAEEARKKAEQAKLLKNEEKNAADAAAATQALLDQQKKQGGPSNVGDLDKSFTVKNMQMNQEFHTLSTKLLELQAQIDALSRGNNPALNPSNASTISGNTPQQAMELQTIYLQSLNAERTFPAFPADVHTYRRWKISLQMWQNTNSLIPNTSKAAFLSASINKNNKFAAQVIMGVEECHEDSFRKMLNILDEHFDTLRVDLFNHINELSLFSPTNAKGSERLGEIFHMMSKCMTNVDSIIREVVGSDIPLDSAEFGEARANAMLSAVLFKLLDEDQRKRYINKKALKPNTVPRFQDIMEWIKDNYLNCRATKTTQLVTTMSKVAISNSAPKKQHTPYSTVRSIQTRTSPKPSQFNSGKKRLRCGVCTSEHRTIACPRYQKLNSKERKAALVLNKTCFVCLAEQYDRCKCYTSSSYKCKICEGKHHTSLCDKEVTTRQVNTAVEVEPASPEIYIMVQPTFLCNLVTRSGSLYPCRGLIDSGADSALMTYEVAEAIGAKKIPTQVRTFDFQGQEVNPIKHRISLYLKPRDADEEVIADYIPVVYLRKTLGRVKPAKIPARLIQGVQLADDSPQSESKIDLIVPSSFAAQIKREGFIRLTKDLILENSTYGYLCQGQIRTPSEATSSTTIRGMSTSEEEKINLDRFFDHIGSPPQEDDAVAETIYKITTQRNAEGQYVVTIPMIEAAVEALGESRNGCYYRIRTMWNKLSYDQKVVYLKQFQSLLDNNYARFATRADKKGAYYIPHFAVIKDSLTTALRLVFDSSMVTSSGKSFNHIQMTGPRLQPDIFKNMIQFRMGEHAFISDISKMFLQIKVNKDQQHFQHTFMPSMDGSMREVILTTIIFGNKSSPFLAIRTLFDIAEKNSDRYPKAAQVLRHFSYVDDISASFASVQTAQRVARDLTTMLDEAHFTLSKWAATSEEVMAYISEENQLATIEREVNADSADPNANVLGIYWTPAGDVFKLKIKNFSFKPLEWITIRVMLSQAANIYDNTGIISPVFLTARLQIQIAYDFLLKDQPGFKKGDPRYDTPLPVSILERWNYWISTLISLQQLTIPRWTGWKPADNVSLCCFSDGSSIAYGCAIYLRIEREDFVQLTLLLAKSRVKPSKAGYTIPKLELLGFELMVSFAKEIHEAIQKVLELNECTAEVPIHYFTDSEIVLAWVQNDNIVRTSFVQNRLKKIRMMSDCNNLHHVAGEQNIADVASRGCGADELNDIWFNGPHYLRKQGALDKLPKNKFATWEEQRGYQESIIEAYIRKVATSSTENYILNSLNKISSWPCTIARMANIIQAIQNFKSYAMATYEINEEAICCMFRLYQEQYYPEETQRLRLGLKVTNRLASLNLFLGPYNAIRVGSRSQAKHLAYDERNPILLPPAKYDVPANEPLDSGHITNKVIMHYHAEALHGGTDKTMELVNSKYYLPNAKRSIRAILHRCVPCRSFRPTPHQQMGVAPPCNYTPAPTFFHISLDEAGPILVKNQRGRVLRQQKDGKTYKKIFLLLFTCRATRAVHIEIVENLSTNEIFAAFQRFVATRGLPRSILMDNLAPHHRIAKNLKLVTDRNTAKGSDEQLEHLSQAINYLESKYRDQGLIFLRGKGDLLRVDFAPVYAPNFNGICESEIKVAKSHLKRVTGRTVMSQNELITFVKRIEGVMNSKPLLTYEENGKMVTLTPFHFLIGRTGTVVPRFAETSFNLVARFHQQEKLINDFWRRYRNDVLNNLRQRAKWHQPQANLEVGQLVLIKEKFAAVMCWPKAAITEIHPGPDGLVRVVTVINEARKLTQRAVNDLIPLPIYRCIPVHKTAIDQAIDRMSVINADEATAEANEPIWEPVGSPEALNLKTSRERLDIANKPYIPTPMIPPPRETRSRAKKATAASSTQNQKSQNPPAPKNRGKKTAKYPTKKQKDQIPSESSDNKKEKAGVSSPTREESSSAVPSISRTGTVRRSPRFTQKILKFGLSLIFFLTFILGGRGATLGQSEKAQELPPGALMVVGRKMLIDAGTAIIHIPTDIQPLRDREQMRAIMSTFEQQCQRPTPYAAHICKSFVQQLDSAMKDVEEVINEEHEFEEFYSIPSRQRRNPRQGILITLWDFLFKTIDKEEHPLHVEIDGSLRQARYVKKVVTDLNTRMFNMTNEIDRYMSANIKNMDLSRLTASFAAVVNDFKHHAREIKRLYTKRGISNTEFEMAINLIRKQTKHQVAALSFHDLKQMAKLRCLLIKGFLFHVIEIPIVLDEVFNEMIIMPAPINQTSIPNFHVQTIATSRANHIKNYEVIWSNTTSAIISPQEILKSKDNLDCAAAIATQRTTKYCDLIPLQSPYDEWTKLAQNTYGYVSDVKKEILCDDTQHREIIKPNSGIIKLRENCRIETPHRILNSITKEIQDAVEIFHIHINTIQLPNVTQEHYKKLAFKEIETDTIGKIIMDTQDEWIQLARKHKFASGATIACLLIITIALGCAYRKRNTVKSWFTASTLSNPDPSATLTPTAPTESTTSIAVSHNIASTSRPNKPIPLPRHSVTDFPQPPRSPEFTSNRRQLSIYDSLPVLTLLSHKQSNS